MRVWVLPVPGGPWMSAISGAERAKWMADFWEGLRSGVSQVVGVVDDDGIGVGGVWPKRMRMRGVVDSGRRSLRRVIVWFILGGYCSDGLV